MREPGWVYKTPKQPPAACSCGVLLTERRGVHVCPQCDFVNLWPKEQTA